MVMIMILLEVAVIEQEEEEERKRRRKKKTTTTTTAIRSLKILMKGIQTGNIERREGCFSLISSIMLTMMLC
jgi:hypothetical protein